MAIEMFDKALEIDDTYETALSNKAATLHKLGLFEEAIDAYHKILEINPENVNTLINLSVTYYTLKNMIGL